MMMLSVVSDREKKITCTQSSNGNRIKRVTFHKMKDLNRLADGLIHDMYQFLSKTSKELYWHRPVECRIGNLEIMDQCLNYSYFHHFTFRCAFHRSPVKKATLGPATTLPVKVFSKFLATSIFENGSKNFLY